ncbi:type II toxin-antitoxin system prevent-host-death family antitoxin [Acidaminobacter sp. JC074]|uniref:type II toxin-antitoxin system prevent-host-death family antitoxin n=1 Tax=Acidaminobacter sp. JC074 TaxID=2530199 RepID=UPI001F0E0514|nr:type II toxin-antitoxin system prevent-host-death family antitoxin [Acidaminobacter sp. JC074]MCH4887049.1 type II toxin-antitoxin system prevent-host-death family antitoxin [Acidaminobacter sp. JC074]
MKITATDVKNSFGKYLQYALDGHEVIITKNGRSVAQIAKLSDDYIREEEALYVANKKMSYEEFILFTEESDFRYELIDGEVFMLASPSFEHQDISIKLSAKFLEFLKDHKCGIYNAPLDIRLKRDENDQNTSVVQPDIMVICDKENRVDGKYMGIPELVIEILSPSTRSKDMLKKLDLYTFTGIKEYWVVDPDQNLIFIYYFEDSKILKTNSFKKPEILESFLYPDFKIDLSQVF